jgi:hypothetical protein
MNVPQSTGGGGERETLENGSYGARVISIIDQGTQTRKSFDGADVVNREILVVFEIPSELITYEKDGKQVTAPFAALKSLVLTAHPKSSLTKYAAAMGLIMESNGTDTILPAGFNPTSLIDKTALITIGKTSGGNDKITEITSLPKGMEVGARVNELKVLDLDNFDADVFNALSDKMKARITPATEFQNADLTGAATSGAEDVPF